MRSRFRMVGFFALLATAAGAPPATAQTPRFMLEQVMSAPFPSDLVASPTGAKVAWVFDARGVRNVWIAGPPDYRAHAITSYREDDGQEIGELAWTPDGRSIVYTRGGDFEHDREAPNPASDPQGVEQVIWIVSADGGTPRKLAEGRSPAVSPRGDVVAYLFKNQIWTAKLGGDEKPEQLIHAGGKCSGLKWSPDGSKLAFVSARENHSFVGVYDLANKKVLYLDPSVDHDATPEWSPDGKHIAFVRIPTSPSQDPFGARRSGQPWSIHIADAASGASRTLWTAKDGRGSVFHELVGNQQVFWMADERIVFPWEGDGWAHLYAISVVGGDASLMTPGEFEVEEAEYSEGRRAVVFNSNQDDIDRRHLWQESPNSTQPQRLTQGEGIEWAPAVLSDGRVALVHSDARIPARPALLQSDGEIRDLASGEIPRDFPSSHLVTPQPVEISSADGLKLHAQVLLPSGIRPGEKRPAILFLHGGSRRQMLLGWHPMQYYNNAYALNQYLAQLGYIVLNVNYRSGIGYGMEFREALNFGATGASEFQDVLAAGKYLHSRPDVDASRIGLWGGSYGGYLTALGLARASDLFACGVDFHGVHDWNLEFPSSLRAEDSEEMEAWAHTALTSSPLADVKTWRSPVLLIQGDDDRNVAFENMERLVEALRKQDVEFQQMVFPDEVHAFLLHEHWLEAYRAAVAFFDSHLNRRP